MLLWVGAVCWLVWILGSLKVRTPPVSYNLEEGSRGQEGNNELNQVIS